MQRWSPQDDVGILPRLSRNHFEKKLFGGGLTYTYSDFSGDHVKPGHSVKSYYRANGILIRKIHR